MAVAISRESPGKSEPGCKPFIWLVVINLTAAKALGVTFPLRQKAV
jgi:hypothetical protein